jgi:hypothetical protein
VPFVDATAQVAAVGTLKALAARYQPLAIDVQHQQPPRPQFLPKAPVAADDGVQVLTQSDRLGFGDLPQPAMDRPLVGEATAKALAERAVGA